MHRISRTTNNIFQWMKRPSSPSLSIPSVHNAPEHVLDGTNALELQELLLISPSRLRRRPAAQTLRVFGAKSSSVRSDGNYTAIIMAAGLNHIHQLGIIHRDIKPHNILISKAAPSGKTKWLTYLCDNTRNWYPIVRRSR
ncbi:hypothetical protein FB451DRAFT_1359134, partial [Mycena latifolia]